MDEPNYPETLPWARGGDADYCLVLTTCPTRTEAEHLAEGAVRERLAACGQIHAVESFYEWKGQMHREPEWRVAFKARTDAYDALEAWIVVHHSYEVPEIVRLPITGGWGPYLGWIDACASAPRIPAPNPAAKPGRNGPPEGGTTNGLTA
jgi:periplasmic divalent cation tolerance protein